VDAAEARDILGEVLADYRRRTYPELCTGIDSSPTEYREVVGPSGATYQIEVETFWDAHPNGNVRVSAGIDNGGLNAFLPLSADFIKAPDGSFVGESVLTNAIGKTVIVGVTYLDHVGEVDRQVQYWGVIVRVSQREGIVIRLPSGEEKSLPPNPRAFEPAPPGEYRFRSTGEVVANPDLMTTWSVDPQRDMWRAMFAWVRRVVRRKVSRSV
jgi:hypothetical protein